MRVRFDPDQEGLGTFLGSLQREILEYLWIPGILPCTNKRIKGELRLRGCDRQLTTITTTTKRMANAGLLRETKSFNGTYLYSAAMTEEELADRVITRLMTRLLLDWPDRLQTFLDNGIVQQSAATAVMEREAQ